MPSPRDDDKPRKSFKGTTRIGRHVPELLRKAYERHGFAYGEVIARWPQIVGPELAEYTCAQRIRWPRGAVGAARSGGTLVVRVDGPMAIEVQHMAPQIIERINGFYGYGAVTALKIVQGRVARGARRPRREPPALDADRETALRQQVDGVGDARLRDTLSKLGRNIMFAKK